MFPRRFRVCELFGIPLYFDVSLVVLLVLFVMDFGSLAVGLACAAALAASITLHELGHALTARVFGCPTRDITISLIGGCASLVNLPRKAGQEFLTAVAGPAVSFALSAAGWIGLNVLQPRLELVAVVFFYLMWANLWLGAFNLLPGFPMDGGRIFRSVARLFTTRVKATYAAMVVGRVFAVLLGLYGLHRIFNHGPWGGISLLIAWMIWREGWREYQQAASEEAWGGHWEYSARVSPPPYGGDDDEVEIRKWRR